MRKVLIGTLLILLCCNIYNVLAQNEVDANGLRQGYWERKDSKGKIAYKATFKDGYPVGEMLRFAPSGVLKVKLFYKDTTDVSITMLYSNGNVQSSGNMKNKKRTGEWSYFYETGEIALRENYENSLLEGTSIKYYLNGVPYERVTYKKGKIDGSYSVYHENEKPAIIMTYRDGIPFGDYTSYNYDGKIRAKGFYDEGFRDGTWTYYSYNGNNVETSTINFKDGYREDHEKFEKEESDYLKEMSRLRGKIKEITIDDVRL